MRYCFLREKQERKNHFLKHLQQGGSIPVEDLPVIRESDSAITKFSINYEMRKDYYNFEKPSELIENFFSVIGIRFDTFCIRNYQPPPENVNNVVGLYDKRFWSTEVYNGRFFNNYIKTSLTYDIKKRIISNAKTGSSWRFNRFESFSVTFNTLKNQRFLKH